MLHQAQGLTLTRGGNSMQRPARRTCMKRMNACRWLGPSGASRRMAMSCLASAGSFCPVSSVVAMRLRTFTCIRHCGHMSAACSATALMPVVPMLLARAFREASAPLAGAASHRAPRLPVLQAVRWLAACRDTPPTDAMDAFVKVAVLLGVIALQAAHYHLVDVHRAFALSMDRQLQPAMACSGRQPMAPCRLAHWDVQGDPSTGSLLPLPVFAVPLLAWALALLAMAPVLDWEQGTAP